MKNVFYKTRFSYQHDCGYEVLKKKFRNPFLFPRRYVFQKEENINGSSLKVHKNNDFMLGSSGQLYKSHNTEWTFPTTGMSPCNAYT